MKIASIHGRFQPFHNAHMEYAKAALENCDLLYIGLTKVLPAGLFLGQEHAPHRDLISSNPFSYAERVSIIENALRVEGIGVERFRIVPFPIENIRRLPEFWSKDHQCFTTIRDKWNLTKIEILRDAGYEVDVLKDSPWEGDAYASGTEIREMIRNENDEWRSFVPRGSAEMILSILSARDI